MKPFFKKIALIVSVVQSLAGILLADGTKDSSIINREDIQSWAAAWNSHDVGHISNLFSEDVIVHQPSNPKPLGIKDIPKFFGMIFNAYPDFHVEVTDTVIEGLKAVSIERVTGTWLGSYTDPATNQTSPGNGKKFDHPGVMILTYLPNHKIKQVDIYWDRLVVNQQLGLLSK